MEPLPPGAEPPLQPKKSGTSGCMIALFVALGIGVLIVVALIIGVVVIANNPTVKKVVGAMGGVINAPGRQEIGNAGCEIPMVMDMRHLADLAADNPKADPEAVAQMRRTVFINCLYVKREPTLGCADIARIYGQAVPDGPPQATVYVHRDGNEAPICQGLFDPKTGERIGDAMPPPRGQFDLTHQPPPPASPLGDGATPTPEGAAPSAPSAPTAPPGADAK